jgi:heterodisulfide reductase subunit A
MSALKQLYLLREKLPDVELNLCYMDIRSYGKKYEEFYRTVRGVNTNVFHGRPSEVRKNNDELIVEVFDTITGKLFEISSDMVVLVPALIPRNDAEDIARKLRISQSDDGFFLEAHPKLRPMDTATGGVFLSGCCQGPKDIQDTVAQASGAASRVINIISKDKLEVEPLIACVDEDLCSGCGICISVCAYKAIDLVKKDDGKSQSKVNEALCMGCGVCAVSCPSSAMQQKGYKDKQMIPMIEESV